MGFTFRKSANLGPFRLNLSKSGMGWSVGGPGFRTGTSARGRKYSTFSLPGTGIGYRAGRGCLIALVPALLSGLLCGGYLIFEAASVAGMIE